jgi:hypothetical protein
MQKLMATLHHNSQHTLLLHALCPLYNSLTLLCWLYFCIITLNTQESKPKGCHWAPLRTCEAVHAVGRDLESQLAPVQHCTLEGV